MPLTKTPSDKNIWPNSGSRNTIYTVMQLKNLSSNYRIMYKLQLYPGIDCFTDFRVRVLQILVQSTFYKFESSPRFTNLSPVRVLQI